MISSATMILCRSSRRWSITDMRPSGSRWRRRRSFRRTVGSPARTRRQAALGGDEALLQRAQVVARRQQVAQIHRQPLGLPGQLVPAGAEHDQDRKSTRLNSSHVEISYAVFCLKKKKKYILFFSYHNKKKKIHQ